MEEEQRIVNHVVWRQSIGYGVDWLMVNIVLKLYRRSNRFISATASDTGGPHFCFQGQSSEDNRS